MGVAFRLVGVAYSLVGGARHSLGLRAAAALPSWVHPWGWGLMWSGRGLETSGRGLSLMGVS